MSKIDLFESLKKILPSESANEVTSAVDSFLAEARDELKAEYEAEFNTKLEEAYTELSQELADAEKTAIEGYQEAYNVINDLLNRLELKEEEHSRHLEHEFEEAWTQIKAERAKNNTLEVDLHEQYTSKFNEARDFIVEKMSEFLEEKGPEIYESAVHEVLNNPRYAEHKVALDKIVEVTSSYLTEEEQTFATSSKLEEAARHIKELENQVKFMEARQIRLSGENHRLLENVRTKEKQINEATQADRKERVKKAKNVSGRGFIDQSSKNVVLAEYNESRNHNRHDEDEDEDQLFEGYEGADLNAINLLAGTKETKKSKKKRSS